MLETETEEKEKDEALKEKSDNLKRNSTKKISDREDGIKDVRKDLEAVAEHVINETDDLKDALAKEITNVLEGDKTSQML